MSGLLTFGESVFMQEHPPPLSFRTFALMPITYEHSPRPVGGPIHFSLEGDRLTVDSGRKVREVRLGAVDLVRMTFEPGRFAQKAYRTKVVMKDGKTFTFTSLTWRSLVEAREQGPEYRAFSEALLGAILRANPDARFAAGKPLGLWLITSAIGIASLIVMALPDLARISNRRHEHRADGSIVCAGGDLADRADGPPQQTPAVRPEGAACRIAAPIVTGRQLRTTSTEHLAWRTIVDAFEPSRNVAMVGRWEPITTRSAPVFSTSSRTSL